MKALIVVLLVSIALWFAYNMLGWFAVSFIVCVLGMGLVCDYSETI